MSEQRVEPGRNYFELFGLPATFDVHLEALALRYRDMQREVHPDRFASGSDAERRRAVQQSSYLNEAFRTLKVPLARARYLLEQGGVPFDETDTRMDPGFLMEQMELREALAEVREADDPFTALTRVRSDIEGRERTLVEELRAAFNQGGGEALERARETVRKMQFLQRLLDETSELEDELTHAM